MNLTLNLVATRHLAPAQAFEVAVRTMPADARGDDLVIDIAVRVAAETLGDAAYYLRVVGPDELEGVKYFHRDLDRHLATRRLNGKRTSVHLADCYRAVLTSGEALIIDEIGVDRLRTESGPAYAELAAAIRIRAAALAPVIMDGRPVGVLGLLRESTHQVRAVEVRDLMGLAESLGEHLAR